MSGRIAGAQLTSDGEVIVKKISLTGRFHTWFNSWSEVESESEGGRSGLGMREEGRTGLAATLSPRNDVYILLICFTGFFFNVIAASIMYYFPWNEVLCSCTAWNSDRWSEITFHILTPSCGYI